MVSQSHPSADEGPQPRSLEPRSFEPKVGRVAEFVPIDPEGKTDRELIIAAIGGIQATHGCIDGFRVEQAKVNEASALTRAAMVASLANLETRQDISDGRLTKLAQMFGAEKPEPGEKRAKGHSIAAWGPLKAAAAIGGLIAGLAALYKLAVALAPAGYGVLVALHRYLLTVGAT